MPLKSCGRSVSTGEKRIRIVRGIKENLKDEREVLDFIAGIFLTGETDTEVLYHCDELLLTIGTEEAKAPNRRMFEHWPTKRQYKTHEAAFKQDKFWQPVEIKGGEFKTASNEDDDEKPIPPVKVVNTAVVIVLMMWHGITKMRQPVPSLWGENSQTNSEFMTCVAMFMNGASIGMTKAITRLARSPARAG